MLASKQVFRDRSRYPHRTASARRRYDRPPARDDRTAVATAAEHRVGHRRRAHPDTDLRAPARRAGRVDAAVRAGRSRGHQPDDALAGGVRPRRRRVARAHERSRRSPRRRRRLDTGRPPARRADPPGAHRRAQRRARRIARGRPATIETALGAFERLARSSRSGARDARDPRRPRHLRLPVGPELPPLLRRPGDLADRDLDADDGPVVARPHADPLRRRPRRDHRAADDPGPAADPVRRGARRPRRQAPHDGRPAERDGRAGARARAAHGHRRRQGVGDRRARRPARRQQRVREPRSAVVHHRDGRGREHPQCGQPQLGARQRRALGRAGDRRDPDRDRRDRRVLPGQRRELRRRRVLALDARPRGAVADQAGTAQPGPAPRGLALRARHSSAGDPAA